MRRAPRSGLVFALGFSAAASLGAGAAWAGDPARDLGDIEPAASKDIDDANTAESQDLDPGARRGTRGPAHRRLERARRGGARAPRARPATRSRSTRPTPTRRSGRRRTATSVEVDLGSRPPASDVDGWRGELQNAEAALDKARTKLAAADAEYTYARNRKSPRGEALKKIVDMRDNARTDFARARCSLPARVDEARRLGVPPEVWRDFPASME